MNLIGDDYSLTYEIGSDSFYGAAPSTYGTAVNMTANGSAIFDRAELRAGGERVNVKGGGDRKVRNRYHSESDEIEIRGMVAATQGLKFIDYRFYYIRITLTPHSPTIAPREFVGVIVSARSEAEQGRPQAETVVIDLNPDIAA